MNAALHAISYCKHVSKSEREACEVVMNRRIGRLAASKFRMVAPKDSIIAESSPVLRVGQLQGPLDLFGPAPGGLRLAVLVPPLPLPHVLRQLHELIVGGDVSRTLVVADPVHPATDLPSLT